jgi:hypothetical protein
MQSASGWWGCSPPSTVETASGPNLSLQYLLLHRSWLAYFHAQSDFLDRYLVRK